MPNTRETLIELLKDGGVRDFPFNAALADYLIANGVTVQQWIPVTERLPEGRCDVLVLRIWWGERKPTQIGWYNEVARNWYLLTEDGYIVCDKVTHWMPLPQPPKGE